MEGHSGPAQVVKLHRFHGNPVLEPRRDHDWESCGVLNPAAIHLDGRVHLLYRAVGSEGISVLGHASSADGEHFDERADAPVYRSRTVPVPATAAGRLPPHASGGSWHGCEDPRLTRVGGRIYMTYTDFGGWESPPAVALTSIAVEDFLAKRWRWTPAHIISPPGECHKNWVVFPALFKGRYAILHSLMPELQVSYVESLEDLAPGAVRSRHYRAGEEAGWDTWVRGAGAPPIETAAGWVLLYHAMDRDDPGRYKLGALLLDRDDPARVLARLPYPLLEPNARYENSGFKAGVVYNCGAVMAGGRLMAYYGGADTVVCGASIGADELLGALLACRGR